MFHCFTIHVSLILYKLKMKRVKNQSPVNWRELLLFVKNYYDWLVKWRSEISWNTITNVLCTNNAVLLCIFIYMLLCPHHGVYEVSSLTVKFYSVTFESSCSLLHRCFAVKSRTPHCYVFSIFLFSKQAALLKTRLTQAKPNKI